jgi:hypothetical protein
MLIQGLNRKGGLIPRPMKADVDKITRALPIAQAVKNGRVWWPEPGASEWVRHMEAEMEAFPTPGVHDDIVDTLAYGGLAWLTMTQYKPPEKDMDTSMEARVRRDLAKRLRKGGRGRPRHPVLGKL